MRILFALPGLHRVERGAEVAFMSIATALAQGGDEVTLIGSGTPRAGTPYRFIHAGAVPRERFEALPSIPVLRGDTAYEEASFVPGLLKAYRPYSYDVTVTCGFPFTNWTLRRPVRGGRPPHVFVTQNGEWPAISDKSEYRFFGCEGLVCTNPDFFENSRDRWNAALIPNGVAMERFRNAKPDRAAFGFPPGAKIVLMVSALIESKRVADGVRAVAELPDVHLVCAGDGGLRDEIDALAERLMPGRFTRLTVTPGQMPALYRSADLFLHLSRDESFGNVYVEALASDLPIVAHDMARVRWIVGDDAILVDTTDHVRLVAALQDAVDQADRSDPSRVRRAEQFDWTSVAARYRDFLTSVVANTSSI